MCLYVSLCVFMCLYASLCVLMGPYWSLSVFINPSSPCASLCFHKGPNRFFISPHSFHGFHGVFTDPYAFFCVFMGFYGSLYVHMPSMDSSGSLWVIIGPYVSFLVLMDSYRS